MSSTYKQAQKLFESKKIPAAAILFEKTIKEDPYNIDAKIKLGICRFRQKDFVNAEKIFREITSVDHTNFKAWYYLGLCAERQGRENDAISTYRIVLAINPEYIAAKKNWVSMKHSKTHLVQMLLNQMILMKKGQEK